MTYVFGALAGLIWGAAAAFINLQITKKGIARNSASFMLVVSLTRTFVDVAFLAAIFLARDILPFSYAAALVGTAIAMSMLTIVFSYKLAKPEQKPEEKQEEKQEK